MPTIAAFGEILYDVYPEQELLGGAPFNFIYHVRQLTGNGAFISCIGNDDRGKKITLFFGNRKIDGTYLQIDPHHPTGAALVTVNDAGVPTFTIADDAAYDFIEPDPEALSLASSCEVLYFGTLAQRSTTSRDTLHTLCEAASHCFLDVNLRQHFYTKEILQSSLDHADIVKLNDEELQTIHSLFFSEPFEPDHSALLLMKYFSLSHLAVTMGSEGSILFSTTEKHLQKSIAEKVIDTVGAGDGFAAMLCAGLLAGWPLEKIHRAASNFSAALCGIEGALPDDDTFYDTYRKLFHG
jgi:fructokinase